MPPQPWQVRTIAAEELDAFLDVVTLAFGADPDPAERAVDRDVFEVPRCLVCDDPDGDGATAPRFLGTTAALSFRLGVPGDVLPAAGVTAVAVAPTARRRGVLTALMHRQLADVARQGEALAVLFASEAAIYGRYGYGAAAPAWALTVPRTAARLRRPAGSGRLRLSVAADAQPELATVYDRLAPQRPGFFARTEVGWRLRLFDPPSRRRGYSALRAVLYDGAAGVDGYALYRTKPDFAESQPTGEVAVVEVLAADPAAAGALWQYLLGLDLMARTTAVVAADDPVLSLLVDPYLARPRLTDNLWVRLVDLPAALAGRRYAAPVDVTIEVADPVLPANAGRWRLRGGPDGAHCARTGEAAQLAADVDALGAAYLGGAPLLGLAGAGRVQELRPRALAAATTAFGWPRQPFCPQLF